MLAYDYDYQKRPLKNTWFWYCINERILVHLLLTTTTNERMNDWVLKLFNMFYTLTHTYTFTLSVTRRYLYYIKSFTSHYYLLMMMLPQKKKILGNTKYLWNTTKKTYKLNLPEPTTIKLIFKTTNNRLTIHSVIFSFIHPHWDEIQ